MGGDGCLCNGKTKTKTLVVRVLSCSVRAVESVKDVFCLLLRDCRACVHHFKVEFFAYYSKTTTHLSFVAGVFEGVVKKDIHKSFNRSLFCKYGCAPLNVRHKGCALFKGYGLNFKASGLNYSAEIHKVCLYGGLLQFA